MDDDAFEFWRYNDVPPRVFAYLMDKCVDIGRSSHNALLAGLSHLSRAYAGTLDPARLEAPNLEQNQIFPSKILTSWFNTVAARKPPSVSPSTLPAEKIIDISEPSLSPVEEKSKKVKKGKKRTLTDEEREHIAKESETLSKC